MDERLRYLLAVESAAWRAVKRICVEAQERYGLPDDNCDGCLVASKCPALDLKCALSPQDTAPET